jgi:hypothetical protein
MTAHEILLETVRLRGEDTTDTSLLAEYNAVALIGMNEGYRDICSRIIVPTEWKSVTLDANKKFAISGLTNVPQEILAICKAQDFTSGANYGKAERYGWAWVDTANIVVPTAEASGTVYVLYEIMPADLVNPYPVAVVGPPAHVAGDTATSPSLIPAQYHRALAFKANAKLLASKDLKDSSMFWEAEYEAFIENMRPPQRQTVIDSWYGV